jgi:hypothetical protein
MKPSMIRVAGKYQNPRAGRPTTSAINPVVSPREASERPMVCIREERLSELIALRGSNQLRFATPCPIHSDSR